MNYTKLFYWLTVADNAKSFFIAFLIIFTAIAGISILVNLIAAGEDDQPTRKVARSWIKWSLPFSALFWALFIFTPDKKDALLIVAGGGVMNYLSNDSTAKEIPHELLVFTKTELQNMSQEAKVNLGIQSEKEKILDEVKNMTSQQVLDRMKLDTTFAKIVLNR